MKNNYLQPLIICEQVRIENGFASSSANGFTTSNGFVIGKPDDPGNGYDAWDNGTY